LIVQLDKDSLFSIFSVSSFFDLEKSLQLMAPSMVEYYLSDLSDDNMQKNYLNKSNIQQSISFDEYSLYLDYGENIYLEFVQNNSYETQTLW
jgi:hypothetical protein